MTEVLCSHSLYIVIVYIWGFGHNQQALNLFESTFYCLQPKPETFLVLSSSCTRVSSTLLAYVLGTWLLEECSRCVWGHTFHFTLTFCLVNCTSVPSRGLHGCVYGACALTWAAFPDNNCPRVFGERRSTGETSHLDAFWWAKTPTSGRRHKLFDQY